MIHVQSPCVTYNDTYQLIKGNAKEGIAPALWDIPDDHDPASKRAAYDLVQQGGLPVGVIYKDETRPSLDANMEAIRAKAPLPHYGTAPGRLHLLARRRSSARHHPVRPAPLYPRKRRCPAGKPRREEGGCTRRALLAA